MNRIGYLCAMLLLGAATGTVVGSCACDSDSDTPTDANTDAVSGTEGQFQYQDSRWAMFVELELSPAARAVAQAYFDSVYNSVLGDQVLTVPDPAIGHMFFRTRWNMRYEREDNQVHAHHRAVPFVGVSVRDTRSPNCSSFLNLPLSNSSSTGTLNETLQDGVLQASIERTVTSDEIEYKLSASWKRIDGVTTPGAEESGQFGLFLYQRSAGAPDVLTTGWMRRVIYWLMMDGAGTERLVGNVDFQVTAVDANSDTAKVLADPDNTIKRVAEYHGSLRITVESDLPTCQE